MPTKIHVAPCSCELHVRIRELEAELVEARRHEHEAIEAYDRQYARDKAGLDIVQLANTVAEERQARQKVESELAHAKDLRSRQPALVWKARAEKAEKHSGFHNDCPDCIANDDRFRALNARHGECQARVAEWKLRAERAEITLLGTSLSLPLGHHEKDVEAREREKC